VAAGVRFLDRMFVGPENQEIWCGNFEEYQLGALVTALRIDAFEWSAGSGFALTFDHRIGPYLRVGFATHY
jgi:Cellulose biosynthesis protein BcsS